MNRLLSFWSNLDNLFLSPICKPSHTCKRELYSLRFIVLPVSLRVLNANVKEIRDARIDICVKLLLDFRFNLRWRWLRASRLCPSPAQFKLHRSSAPPPPPPLPPRRSPFALPCSLRRLPSPPAPSSQGALHFHGACRAMAAS